MNQIKLKFFNTNYYRYKNKNFIFNFVNSKEFYFDKNKYKYNKIFYYFFNNNFIFVKTKLLFFNFHNIFLKYFYY